MKANVFLSGIAVVAILSIHPAEARDPFRIGLTVGASVDSKTFGRFEDFIDNIDSGSYDSINSSYTQQSIARSDIDFRGLPLTIDYPTVGTRLEFIVPSLGVNEDFTGATREESEDLLLDYLRANGDDLLKRILQKLAGKTPIDPVAGNPNSLQSKLVEAAFSSGSTVGPMPSNSARSGDGDGEGGAEPALFGLNGRFGHFSSGDYDTVVYDLPLAYVIPLADPRYAVNLDLPITYIESDGAASFSGSLGIGLRLPILDNWTMTPAVRIGATGSRDLGTMGAMYNVSLTSSFIYDFGDYTFALGNMGAFTQTLPISRKVDGFEIEYDLTNFVTRNGVSVSSKSGLDFFGKPLTIEASAVNTQFFGDDLFVENYTDIAISAGTEASSNRLTWDSMRLGVTYTFTDQDYSGVRLNFGYQF